VQNEWVVESTPLKSRKQVTNENTKTLLVDRPIPNEAISNIFELPSMERSVLYTHAAAGFPIK